MKAVTLFAMGLGLAGAALPVAAEAQRWQPINQRQANLYNRIEQGVRSGALNRAEAGRLRTEFRNLNSLEYRYRRSGGGLSAGERNDLNRRFDALSARVYTQKHDRQHRR
jgi:hypothetical protein